MSTNTGIDRPAAPRPRAARRPSGGNPFDGARVSDDPVMIARVRYRLAFDALLEIRPGSREERELGRRVLDIAAGELEAALAAERRRRPPPLPAARLASRRPPPLRPSVAVANDLAGRIFADR